MEKDMLLKIVTKAENKELFVFNSLTKVEKKLNTQKRRQKHC
jgi:hypothetical protein